MFECVGLDVKDVKRVLTTFKKVTPRYKNDKNKINTSVFFIGDNNELKMVSTDMETIAQYTLHASFEPGTIAINMQDLSRRLKSFKNGSMVIKQLDKHNVEIIVNNSKIKMELVNPTDLHQFEDFTIPEIVSSGDYLDLDKNFFNALKRAITFAAKDDFMRNLNGIEFENKKLVAADGFRLTVQKVQDLKIDDKFIISLKDINLIKSSEKLFNKPKFYHQGLNVVVDGGNFKLLIKKSSAEFPDWQRVFKDYYESAQEQRTILKPFDDVIPVLENAKNATETDSVFCQVNGNVVIQTRKYKSKEITFEQELPTKKQGDDITIAFNPDYLIDVFKSEKINRLEFANENTPILAESDENCYIVMPIRQI